MRRHNLRRRGGGGETVGSLCMIVKFEVPLGYPKFIIDEIAPIVLATGNIPLGKTHGVDALVEVTVSLRVG
jgi:hypothetical protein